MMEMAGPVRRTGLAGWACLLLACVCAAPAWADNEGQVLTAYRRADLMQASMATGVFRNVAVHPRWIDDTRFWYTRDTGTGSQWVLVDAEQARSRPAFDQHRLAAALAASTGKQVE